MGAYTPPAPVDGNPFSPSVVKGGFDDFATAINGNVESTNNITTPGQLDYRHVHRDALTGVWKATSRGVVASMPVRYGGAAQANTLTVRAGRSCIWLNQFDVEDCSIRIHLPQAATVHVSANVDLTYAKTENVSGRTFTHIVHAYLMRGNANADATTASTVELSADAVRAPISLSLQLVNTLAAGTYDYWVRLDFRSSHVALGINQFIHWVSVARGMQIVANYKQ